MLIAVIVEGGKPGSGHARRQLQTVGEHRVSLLRL